MRSIRDDDGMLPLADADLIWQQCLFAFEEPSIDDDFSSLTRTWLDDDSWIDYAPTLVTWGRSGVRRAHRRAFMAAA